jgi:hypothetical protein
MNGSLKIHVEFANDLQKNNSLIHMYIHIIPTKLEREAINKSKVELSIFPLMCRPLSVKIIT